MMHRLAWILLAWSLAGNVILFIMYKNATQPNKTELAVEQKRSLPNNFDDCKVHRGQGFDLEPGQSAIVTLDTQGNSTYQKRCSR